MNSQCTSLKCTLTQLDEVMDVRSLIYQNSSFDLIVDKACLDCLYQSQTPYKSVQSALTEIHRCLTPNGTYALLSNSPGLMRQHLWALDWVVREVPIPKLPMRYVDKDKDVDYPKKYFFFFCSKGV